MCASMPVSFQRNVTFAKARPTQMIFITTSVTTLYGVFGFGELERWNGTVHMDCCTTEAILILFL